MGAKIGQGKAHYIKDATQINEFKKGEVLVTEITDPDWEPIMKIASALLSPTAAAGLRTRPLSRRELGIPAIVGTGNATEVLKTGMEITVSCAEGEVGKVYEGLLKFEVNKHRSHQFSSRRKPKLK